MRDPRIDPVVGDQLLHPVFGRGCIFTVKRRLSARTSSCSHKGKRGPCVSCSIEAVDGHHVEQRGRTYALSYWPEFMASAYVLRFAGEADE